MILALDISTSCTGYCIFDNEDKLREIEAFKLSKHKTFFEKAQEMKSQLSKIKDRYNITSIAVEENLQAFRPGLSSANTILKLAQFNGVVQWICLEVFGIEPKSINVNTARRINEIKVDRKSSKTTKEQILEWVARQEPDYQFPTKVLKSGRNKGQVRFCNECYDMADAYVIGKAHILFSGF
jgi:Holliday junction resolvasome RuvABC endonuclease subunit